jgi:hypothetical protein
VIRALSLFFVLGCSVAHAQVGQLPQFVVPTAAVVPFSGPGDIQAFTAWYGLRAYTAAIAAAGTQKLVRVRRASDSEQCDILVATSGGMGLTANCTGADAGQTLTTFITSTTGFVVTWYDQVSTRNVTQATAGAQPPIFATGGASGSKPYIASTNGTSLVGPSFTPASGVVSFSVVGVNNGVAGNTGWIREQAGAANKFAPSGANTWTLGGGGGGSLNATATDTVWHAANTVINGASPASVANVDNVETTGSVTGGVGAGTIGVIVNAQAGSNLRIEEVGFADNVAFSAGVRTSLNTNLHTYWGF